LRARRRRLLSTIESKPFVIFEEGARMANICNACRYCEGYCAVFPALERRLSFAQGDLTYLANLCHNCGSCYYACQYAPPHEFQVNLPKLLAELRTDTYKRYAWPRFFAVLFDNNAVIAASLTAICITGWLILVSLAGGTRGPVASGNFYTLVSHRAMVVSFALIAIFDCVAFAIGFARYWSDVGEKLIDLGNPGAVAVAVRDALTLRYLDGGGEGCTYPNEEFSGIRRRYHHFTFYGFMLCFASTCVAAFYDNVLGWKAPYPLLSAPVLLGLVGGIGLLTGTAGLLWIKRRRDAALTYSAHLRVWHCWPSGRPVRWGSCWPCTSVASWRCF
jgi:citrate/tricarballylate utilization protein